MRHWTCGPGASWLQTTAFLLAKIARREGVNDSSRKKIKQGSLIRFRCQGDQVLIRVTRYASFEEMFDHESGGSRRTGSTTG